MNNENKLRMEHLENKAKREYIENSDWSDITGMLTEDEQEELKELYEEFSESYEESILE